MSLHVVRLQDVPSTPWRNGRGDTHELLTWPSAGAWLLRISVATIAQAGPFSAYPGVQRWFSVVDGPGVLLTFGGERRERCTRSTSPLSFDGGDAPDCLLLDGVTRDLNLMVRANAGHGRLERAVETLSTHDVRAVYAADAATLRRGDGPAEPLAAGSLAWSADREDRTTWRIDATDAAAASRCWWATFDHAAPSAHGLSP